MTKSPGYSVMHVEEGASNAGLRIDRLPRITFVEENGEREFNPADYVESVFKLAGRIESEFPGVVRLGLIWRTGPELMIAWLAVLAAKREPLLLEYPNEKQNLVQWRQSISNSVESADLGGLIVADEPALQNLDFVPCFSPTREALQLDNSEYSLSPIPLNGAILQMSSGTTGHRKPIRFEIADVAAHVRSFNQVLNLGPDDRIVSWLPLYHDMGFVACFLMPLMLGIPTVMIDPVLWIRKPRLLVDAINRYRGTICYMPNFGFEVMTLQCEHEPMPSMRLWISCSEPARLATMQRFSLAFEVPERSTAVCYAMAENIFAVTFNRGIKPLGTEGSCFVSCGAPIPGVDLKLKQGEIWVRSDTSLERYCNSDSLVDAEGYYATGDLGQMIGGELVVVGRKRDLINIAGKKHMLSELEQSALALVGESKGRVAAVAWCDERLGTETPLLLAETDEFFLRRDQQALAHQWRTAVGLEAGEVAFVPPRFLVKTSSGKINRTLSAMHYRQVFDVQKTAAEGRGALLQALRAEYGNLPWDEPVSNLFDSLGFTFFAVLLDEYDVSVSPRWSIDDHLRSYLEKSSSGSGEAETEAGHISIIWLADAKLTRSWTDQHLARLSAAVGRPVSFEYLCLPPVPVVLSDLVFHDYFLPRERDQEKYAEIKYVLGKLKNASIVIVDDVAEMLFGEGYFPFLNHQFRRSPQADRLIYRFQKYTRNHHELPVGVANLHNTRGIRDEYIDRLSDYLGVPVFRIATLESCSDLTKNWDYVEWCNSDWTMELDSDSDAMVEALAAFMRRRKGELPVRTGEIRRILRHVAHTHFCSMVADKSKIDELISRYDSFCIYGPRASLPYFRKCLEAEGKSYVIADRSSELSAFKGQFDCVVQTGTTGRPRTAKPVFQIFWAAWGYVDCDLPTVFDGLNPHYFHAATDTVVNELKLLPGLPDTPLAAVRSLKRLLAETERKAAIGGRAGSVSKSQLIEVRKPLAVRTEYAQWDRERYRNAEFLLNSGDRERAAEILESLVEGETAVWEVYNDLGALTLEAGEKDRAMDLFRTAASLEKDTSFALRNIAELCRQNGNLAEAIKACAQILRVEPDDGSIPLFLRDMLLEINVQQESYSWLLPGWSEKVGELDRLRRSEAEQRDLISSLTPKAAFFEDARRVLDNLP